MNNGEIKMSKTLSIDDLKSEGCLLWAKIKGYSYWPGIVTVDPMDGLTVKTTENASRTKVHVHFLGYGNMRAWVPSVNVMLFEGKAAYDTLATNAKNKSKIKDFYPTKKYIRLFEKAVEKAEETYLCPQELRLKKLGLVYVLIEDDEDEKPSPPKNGTNKELKINDTAPHNTNGNANLPKITTGFFKNYQPILTPSTKPDKSNIDVFEFDDSEDQFGLDFQLNAANSKEQAPNAVPSEKPLLPKPKTISTPKQPKVTKKRKLPCGGSQDELTNLSSNKQPKVPSVKRKKTSSNSGGTPKKRKITTSSTVKVTSHNDGEAIITDLQENSQDDDFQDGDDSGTPSLGSLVWGRMSGFPYWPCFVTRSPGGDFTRVFGKRKEHHAQFFNWNNESGWISGAMSWCPINEYHAKAKLACPKGPNTPEGRNWYPPARLAARWKVAVLDAQKTAHLTKKERYDSLLVSRAPVVSSKKRKPRTAAAKKEMSTGRPEMPLSSTNSPNDGNDADKVVKNSELDRPCPASKKKVFLESGLNLGKIELPKGWSYELCKTDDKVLALKFHSPEGIVYDGVRNAVAHLLQQNCCPTGTGNIGQRRRRRSFSTSSCLKEQEDPGRFGWFLRCTDKMHFDTRPYCADQVGQLEGPVEYLKDESLPSAWSVRTIRDRKRKETLYQSSSIFRKTSIENSTATSEFTFNSKVSVAQFLEGMGHPALEIEQLLFNYPKIARVAPKDNQEEEPEPESDCDYNHHSSSQSLKIDDLIAKTVTPCYVDMVKLPDIFLKHPSVRVKESNNEMLIRDSVTDAFIAKKIIYE